MLLKLLLKKPIFVMGIIMMSIFISLHGRTFLEKVGLSSPGKRFGTSSCRGVLAMLERTLPDGQSALCRGNHLFVDMAYPVSGESPILPKKVLCPLLYREMANSLKFLASEQTAPLNILERVAMVRLKLSHPQLTIHATVLGKHLAEISRRPSRERLVEHIKKTVKVQEYPATCY